MKRESSNWKREFICVDNMSVQYSGDAVDFAASFRTYADSTVTGIMSVKSNTLFYSLPHVGITKTEKKYIDVEDVNHVIIYSCCQINVNANVSA